MDDSNQPVTKGEMAIALAALREDIKNDLTEVMRDMQTELLRGFARHLEAVTIRMRRIEADNRNLEASLTPRMAAVEEQLTDLHIRVMKLEGPSAKGTN